jgi:hypothetical protein
MLADAIPLDAIADDGMTLLLHNAAPGAEALLLPCYLDCWAHWRHENDAGC